MSKEDREGHLDQYHLRASSYSRGVCAVIVRAFDKLFFERRLSYYSYKEHARLADIETAQKINPVRSPVYLPTYISIHTP